jgi:hypothetical protein
LQFQDVLQHARLTYTPQPATLNQPQENPLDDEQDEEAVAEASPLFVGPWQQKVESKTSGSQFPQDGQST